jgi:hypothetical protein
VPQHGERSKRVRREAGALCFGIDSTCAKYEPWAGCALALCGGFGRGEG